MQRGGRDRGGELLCLLSPDAQRSAAIVVSGGDRARQSQMTTSTVLRRGAATAAGHTHAGTHAGTLTRCTSDAQDEHSAVLDAEAQVSIEGDPAGLALITA